MQAIGHAQNAQPNSPTLLNQPSTPIQISQPNTPIQFSQVQWSMLREHPCLSMCIEFPRTYIRHSISGLPQTWWSPAVVGCKLMLFQQMFCSRESTNYYLMIQQDEKSTQDGVDFIKGYAGRTLIKTECKYLVHKIKFLALKWAVRAIPYIPLWQQFCHVHR